MKYILLISLWITPIQYRHDLQAVADHWTARATHIKQEKVYKDLEELEELILFLGNDYDLNYTRQIHRAYLKYRKYIRNMKFPDKET